jgi:hypothetical protein
VPYEATYRCTDLVHFTSLGKSPPVATDAFVHVLSESLALVRQVALDHQNDLVQRRTSENAPVPTLYKAGDLVLLKNDVPTSKLQPKFLGQYLVIAQTSNDA